MVNEFKRRGERRRGMSVIHARNKEDRPSAYDLRRYL